jgi:hypothetical protein
MTQSKLQLETIIDRCFASFVFLQFEIRKNLFSVCSFAAHAVRWESKTDAKQIHQKSVSDNKRNHTAPTWGD